MKRDTIIIVLLLVLIGFYIWNMYRKENFMGFATVNYNTLNVACDDLTGSDACIVKTVKPSRELVCNKRFDVVNTNNLDKSNPRNIRKSLEDVGGMAMDQNSQDEMKLRIKNKFVDNGLSFDELDQLSMDQMDMSQMNVQKMDDMMDLMSDDVSYSQNKVKELHNKKVRESLNRDNNTLSDVEEELITLN